MSRNSTKSCDEIIDADIDPGRNIVIVPSTNAQHLTEKERLDYKSYREQFLRWMLNVGRNPEKALGYSPYTVYESGYRAAAFDRWTWTNSEGYHIPPTPTEADEYLQVVAYSDRSQASKGKIEEMMKRYFRWLTTERGGDEWEPDYSFQSGGGGQPRDFLTSKERRAIRQAALEHGNIPSYNNLSPSERGQWRGYVASVLGLSADDVTPDDWNRVDGWKLTSLVWTSLDAGLRPVEVGRAKTS